jgi:hypothetical protein
MSLFDAHRARSDAIFKIKNRKSAVYGAAYFTGGKGSGLSESVRR